jgi:hypothetical protein
MPPATAPQHRDASKPAKQQTLLHTESQQGKVELKGRHAGMCNIRHKR